MFSLRYNCLTRGHSNLGSSLRNPSRLTYSSILQLASTLETKSGLIPELTESESSDSSVAEIASGS